MRVFIKKPVVAKEGEEPSGQVVIRVRWQENEVMFSASCWGNPSKWMVAAQKPRPGTTHKHNGEPYTANLINRKISRLTEAIQDSFTKCFLNGEYPTKDKLKSMVISAVTDDEISARERKKKARIKDEYIDIESMTILEWFSKFKEDGLNIELWSNDMVEKVNAMENHWQDFDPKEKLRLQDITEDTMKEYQAKLVKKGLRNNTIINAIKNIHWFLNYCKKKGAYVRDEALEFKSTLTDVKDKEVVFLTWEEFKTLYNFEIPEDKSYLQKIKDLFIFSCVTGLRYSDVTQLKISNISNDMITVVTEKTDHLLKIDLNQYSREIIDKYKFYPEKKGNVLPHLSNQKCNEYIKLLCKMAGINSPVTVAYRIGNKTFKEIVPKHKVISFHAGRRTYVSLALKLGATPEEVKRITGHHSYSMMQRYIAQDEEQRKHATAVFDIRTERDFLLDQLKSLSNKQLREMIIKYNAEFS